MKVAQIWRYPVKSLQGERVSQIEAGPYGLAGDRHWAIVDAATGLALTARREPALLYLSAAVVGSEVVITDVDGAVLANDVALSANLGRPVRLVEAAAGVQGKFENPMDIETEAADSWITWEGPDGSFHDSGHSQLSLLGPASLGDWEFRRFRANVLLDVGDEKDLLGASWRVGGATLNVGREIARCVMVTRPQPGGIDRDLDVLRTINRERGGKLTVGAIVEAHGLISEGDELRS